MDNLLVILLFVVIIAAVVYAVIRTFPGRDRNVTRVSPVGTRDAHSAYRMVPSLLTDTERNFYSFLVQAVSGEMHIFSKVRLADLVVVKDGVVGKLGHFNRISQKHVDFVLCAPESLRPMLVIELDDSSHAQPEAQARDQVKNASLKAAGLPILRIPTQQSYQIGALAESIRVQLRVNATGLLALPDGGEITRPKVGAGFVSVLRRMSKPAKSQSADKVSKKDSPMRKGNARKQVVVPLAVILVVVFAFAQLKANSTNADQIENTAMDPLLTPEIAAPVEIQSSQTLAQEPNVIDTKVPEVVFSGDATVNAKTLNMRTGPGTQYGLVGAFTAGTRLSLLGKNSSAEWVKVRSTEGQEGWMSAKYLTLSAPLENVPEVGE